MPDLPPDDDRTLLQAWKAPIPLGNRLAWFDGENNAVVPIVAIEATYLDGDMGKGWMATLPTENPMLHVVLSYDQGDLTLHLTINNPVHLCDVDARIVDGEILYSPGCRGGDCEGCGWCPVGVDVIESLVMAARRPEMLFWCRRVASAAEVMDLLRWLSSLPVRAVVL